MYSSSYLFDFFFLFLIIIHAIFTILISILIFLLIFFFKIIIEATRGTTFLGDIAIDDINFSNRPCTSADTGKNFIYF